MSLLAILLFEILVQDFSPLPCGGSREGGSDANVEWVMFIDFFFLFFFPNNVFGLISG